EILREVPLQFLYARTGGLSFCVSVGCMPYAKRGHDRTVIIIVLIRRPATFEPIEAAIGFLYLQYPIEGLARERMKLPARGKVVHCQGCRCRDYLRVPARFSRLFSIVPVSNPRFEKAANFSHRRRRMFFENWSRHQVRIICVASSALPLARPVERYAVQKRRRKPKRSRFTNRLVGGVGE